MSEKADAAEAVELADYRAQKQADALRIQKESDDYLIESLRGDVERLTGALLLLETALEELRHAYDDRNPKGKTIVDFLNVWLDQERERCRCAEAALAAARAEVEQAYRAGYHAYDVECGCPIESVDIENAAAAWSRYQQEK